MTANMLILVVVVPLTAFATVGLALRRGRPRPYQAWDTPRIQGRLRQLAGTDSGTPDERRERRQLDAELFLRGRLHQDE